MTEIQKQKLKDDLKAQIYEHARKIMASGNSMVQSGTPWQRDQFYTESMRHMMMLEQMLGRWRERVAEMQKKNNDEN